MDLRAGKPADLRAGLQESCSRGSREVYDSLGIPLAMVLNQGAVQSPKARLSTARVKVLQDHAKQIRRPTG